MQPPHPPPPFFPFTLLERGRRGVLNLLPSSQNCCLIYSYRVPSDFKHHYYSKSGVAACWMHCTYKQQNSSQFKWLWRTNEIYHRLRKQILVGILCANRWWVRLSGLTMNQVKVKEFCYHRTCPRNITHPISISSEQYLSSIKSGNHGWWWTTMDLRVFLFENGEIRIVGKWSKTCN